MIRTCSKYGVDVNGREQGVWVDGNTKIGFIGLKSADKITSHGIGLNVQLDKSWFDSIVTCGLHGKKVSSICDHMCPNSKKIPKCAEVSQDLIQNICGLLELKAVNSTELSNEHEFDKKF